MENLTETLEEAAKNYANYNEQINKAVQEAVKFGAKWQQERSYSKGDMLKSFYCGKLYQGREGDTCFEQLINKLKKISYD
jgi:hypothetical protein